MALNIEKLMDEGAIAAIEAALKAAYQQGVNDGIARIASLAREPVTLSGTHSNGDELPLEGEQKARKRRKVIRRAPRGAVPKLVSKMLNEHPGKTITEYENMIPDYGVEISPKSVGNQLRRFEGKKYTRDDLGGWYHKGQKETGADSDTETPASDHTNQGGAYETTLATH